MALVTDVCASCGTEQVNPHALAFEQYLSQDYQADVHVEQVRLMQSAVASWLAPVTAGTCSAATAHKSLTSSTSHTKTRSMYGGAGETRARLRCGGAGET